MKSLDSLYCEFVSALLSESDWNKSVVDGICTWWVQRSCIAHTRRHLWKLLLLSLEFFISV